MSHLGRWYVARHKAYQGSGVADRMRDAGFVVHQPLELIRRPQRDDVLRPLFPGYLLVHVDLDDPCWGRLLRVRGVTGLLCGLDGRPLPVPAGYVEALMDEADAYGVIRPRSRETSSPIGRRFMVTVGPWARFVGDCVAARGDRLKLLLDLFGRPTMVSTRSGAVEPVA